MPPSGFGIGDGGKFRAPMATTAIGGLTASTMPSPAFVPAFFLVTDHAETFAGTIMR